MRGAVLLLPALLLCAACSLLHPPGRPAPTGQAVGPGMVVFPADQRSPAPRLSGTTISGDTFRLAPQLGHGPVAINVWASWCAPCRAELPLLARAAGRALTVVGIDERDDPRQAHGFATSRGATYPSLYDPDGKLLARLSMLPQSAVPSTLFIDGHGQVAARVLGPIDARGLQRIIGELGGGQ